MPGSSVLRSALVRSWLVLHLLAPTASARQDPAEPPVTRAEALRAAREAKARDTHAHTPDAVERGLEFFEEKAVFLRSIRRRTRRQDHGHRADGRDGAERPVAGDRQAQLRAAHQL
jgi:hypothetical protein